MKPALFTHGDLISLVNDIERSRGVPGPLSHRMRVVDFPPRCFMVTTGEEAYTITPENPRDGTTLFVIPRWMMEDGRWVKLRRSAYVPALPMPSADLSYGEGGF